MCSGSHRKTTNSNIFSSSSSVLNRIHSVVKNIISSFRTQSTIFVNNNARVALPVLITFIGFYESDDFSSVSYLSGWALIWAAFHTFLWASSHLPGLVQLGSIMDLEPKTLVLCLLHSLQQKAREICRISPLQPMWSPSQTEWGKHLQPAIWILEDREEGHREPQAAQAPRTFDKVSCGVSVTRIRDFSTCKKERENPAKTTNGNPSTGMATL
ncbi:hypothetical protein Bca4012_083608 [Brassica carinata]